MSTLAFRRSFSQLLARSGQNMEAVVRKVALDVLNQLGEKSPVDTGRFRGNWMLAINAPDLSNDAAPGRDANAAGAAAVTAYRLGGKIYITNNLPYAFRLEYGWSRTQAPNGMVRITVAAYGQFLARAVVQSR